MLLSSQGSPAWHGQGCTNVQQQCRDECGCCTGPAGSACALGFASRACSAAVGVGVSSQNLPCPRAAAALSMLFV